MPKSQSKKGQKGVVTKPRARKKSGQSVTLSVKNGARPDSETDVRQTQTLESLGRLAFGIAHDFNNLLSIMSGYSELALNTIEEGHQARTYVEEIRNAGFRGTSLVRQLLDFGRKNPTNEIILDLNEIVIEMSRMLSRLIGEDIELVVDLDRRGAVVRANASQLEQVLVNLVVNARDAMPQGGTLTIRTGDELFNATAGKQVVGGKPGSFVTLSITDTGSGIKDEMQSQIFKPSFTTKRHGSGLGLWIVQLILRQSGGDIQVFSEMGRGTTFKVLLPRASGAPQEKREELEQNGDVNGTETILLVEDDEILRKMILQTLSGFGYKVIEACDGQEALTISQSQSYPIRLVITDVRMPKMGGYELAQNLVDELPGIPVLFMTSYPEETSSRGEPVDQDLFIRKPFAAMALGRKIRSALSNRKKTFTSPRTLAGSLAAIAKVPPALYATNIESESAFDSRVYEPDTRSRPRSRILIVDDDEQIRQLLRDFLNGSKYEVAVASSAEDALRVAKHFYPDVVVADINMGGISGLDMIEPLHKLVPNSVVVMISGQQTIDFAIEAMRLGAFDYITKPLDLRHFEAAIDRAVSYQDVKDRVRRHQDFLSIVSHELRAPLQAPLRYLENVLAGNHGPLSEKQQIVLQRAAKGIGTEVQLVNNLLDLQYFESGRFRIQLSRVSMVTLIEEIIESFHLQIIDREVQLLWKRPADSFEIRVDTEQVKQAISNLLSNAIDHTPSKKRIWIKLFSCNNRTCVIVRDEGTGIPDPYQERVFDRAFQVPTGRRKGLGIGLYIAREIIRAHSGEIKVKSRLEIGSIFMVTLPCDLEVN